mgnify:CR=1 FL=1
MSSPTNNCKTAKPLIVGIGNTIRRDDAAGIITARRAAEISGADFLEATGVDLGLLDSVLERPRIALVDSIITGKNPPGALLEISAAELTGRGNPPGSHRRSLPALLEMASARGIDVSKRFRFYCVEIAENSEFGEELTPAVAESIERNAAEIAADINSK